MLQVPFSSAAFILCLTLSKLLESLNFLHVIERRYSKFFGNSVFWLWVVRYTESIVMIIANKTALFG